VTSFLILLPTFDHQDTLYFSVASVLHQTRSDWELAIILDGSPERSARIAESFAGFDSRIGVHRHPKGERNGEAYRDAVIRASNAKYVFQIGDDDIWMPDHLDYLAGLFDEGDYVSSQHTEVLAAAGSHWDYSAGFASAAAASMRQAVAFGRGAASGPTCFAYRRSTYLQLQEGWATTPKEWLATDWYMTSKFVRQPSVRIVHAMRPTSIKAPASPRRARPREQNAAEMARYLAAACRPEAAAEIAQAIRYEAGLAGWMLSWLVSSALRDLDEILDHAGVRPVVVEQITYKLLASVTPGRSVSDQLEVPEQKADLLLTLHQREQLVDLVERWRLAAVLDRARAQVNHGRYAEALPALVEFNQESKSPEGNYLLGVCRTALSIDLDEAERNFALALNDVDEGWVRYGLACCIFKQGRHVDARKEASAAAALGNISAAEFLRNFDPAED
jgi:hypothetical protein